jgi:FixJ family two-component response regulator
LIAIVEDDAALRDALADLIEVLGFAARAFDSSESFLAVHVPGLFNCLITDFNLLGESGVQLRRRLQVLDPSLPVIIMSGQADPLACAWALRDGAAAYLAKPVNAQVLLQRLNSALGRASRA